MKHSNSIQMFIVFMCAILFSTSAFAQLEPQNNPQNTSSYTLEDLYNRLIAGTSGVSRSFTEPTLGPVAITMHSIDSIMAVAPQIHGSGANADNVLADTWFWGLTSGTWGLTEGTMTNNGEGATITPGISLQTIAAGYWSSANTVSGDADMIAENIKKDVDIFGVIGTYEGGSSYPAPVPKTGQTPTNPMNPAPAGSDGALQKGVAWPSPRFTDNDDGTVTDNLTGLMWLKDANSAGNTKTWADALTYCNNLDDSGYDDWRLPNIKEMQSLINFGQLGPALPSGHPFSNVQTNYYWTSTTYSAESSFAWIMNLYMGAGNNYNKTYELVVWPVRSGNN